VRMNNPSSLRELAEQHGYFASYDKDWLYFSNNKEYDKMMNLPSDEIYKPLGFVRAIEINRPLREYYNKWKVFLHCQEKYLHEVFERALGIGLGNLVSGKISTREKFAPHDDRIVFYVNSDVSDPNEFAETLLKLFPEDYQRKVIDGLKPDTENYQLVFPAKPFFTKQLGPAIFMRQGEKFDREKVLCKGGDMDKYFCGEHWHLLMPESKLQDIVGRWVQVEQQRKSDHHAQTILDSA